MTCDKCGAEKATMFLVKTRLGLQRLCADCQPKPKVKGGKGKKDGKVKGKSTARSLSAGRTNQPDKVKARAATNKVRTGKSRVSKKGDRRKK